MAAGFLYEGHISPTAQQQLRGVGMDEVVTTCPVETGADHRRFPIAIRIREGPSGTAKSVFDIRAPAAGAAAGGVDLNQPNLDSITA